MKKLLLATVFMAALALPAQADVTVNLGTDPTSGAGAFSNTDPGSVALPACFVAGCSGLPSLGGLFTDTYNFHLSMDETLTIAFATNTFAGGNPQFITSFTGAVLNASSVVVLGPEPAASCSMIPNCQVFGGSAILSAGDYSLRITGSAGVDAGYGGNISTAAAVPAPLAGAGIPGLVAACGTLIGFAKRRRKQLAA